MTEAAGGPGPLDPAQARQTLAASALAITEAIPVGTYTMVLPPEGGMASFGFMSERFLQICGLNREEAAADPFKAFACIHPDDYDDWVRLNAETFATKQSFTGECRVIVDGEVRWVRAESVPRDLPDGSTVWEGVLIDITAQRRALQQLAEEGAASVFKPRLGTDWIVGVVGSLQLHHVLDLRRQDKGMLETHLTGYANRQFQLNTTDVALFNINTGPRFQAFEGTFDEFTLRPFLNAGYVWIYDTPYYGGLGAGLEAGVVLSERLRNLTTVRWRQQNHPDTWYLAANSLYTGVEYSASTAFEFQLSSAVTIFANAVGSRFEAAYTPVQSYSLWIAGGGMTFRFADPLFHTEQAWRISLSVNEQWWSYDKPNVAVDPNSSQSQTDTLASLTLAVPFDERTTFQVSAGRFVRTSNLPNYAFENSTAMFGVSWRF